MARRGLIEFAVYDRRNRGEHGRLGTVRARTALEACKRFTRAIGYRGGVPAWMEARPALTVRRNPRRKASPKRRRTAARRTRRNPHGQSESAAWRFIKRNADAIHRHAGLTGKQAVDARAFWATQIAGIATEMLGQLRGGVHENPTLAIVGANPPLGKVIEIRYVRDVGEHPGRYRHVFKRGERPAMVALTDGSLKIG